MSFLASNTTEDISGAPLALLILGVLYLIFYFLHSSLKYKVSVILKDI